MTDRQTDRQTELLPELLVGAKKEIYKNYNNLFLVPPLEKHYPRDGGEIDPRSRTGNTQCPEKQRLDINIRI